MNLSIFDRFPDLETPRAYAIWQGQRRDTRMFSVVRRA